MDIRVSDVTKRVERSIKVARSIEQNGNRETSNELANMSESKQQDSKAVVTCAHIL